MTNRFILGKLNSSAIFKESKVIGFAEEIPIHQSTHIPTEIKNEFCSIREEMNSFHYRIKKQEHISTNRVVHTIRNDVEEKVPEVEDGVKLTWDNLSCLTDEQRKEETRKK